MTTYFMGIDIGLTTTGAAVFDRNGKPIAQAGGSSSIRTPKPGWAETDPVAIWRSVADSAKRAIEASGIDPTQIAAAGVCAWGQGMFAIDTHGEPSYPGLPSIDNRSADVVAKLAGTDTEEAIKKINKVGGVVSSHMPAMARWLRENEPEAFANTDWFCQCKDYINFKLTGVRMTERNDVSGAGYLDMHSSEYSDELFELYGVPEISSRVAPLAPSSQHIVGKVTEEASELTGLPVGTPVCAGMMDISASSIGTGVVEEEYVCSIVGTWGINEYIGPEMFPDMLALLAFDDKYLNMSGGATSAGNLEWFLREFGRSLDCAEDSSIYDVACQHAARVSPDEIEVLYLPYISTPNVHARGRATFSEITVGATYDDLLYALIEGITFEHRRNLERLRARGAKYQTIRLAGGGARNEFWSQMFADITGTPTEVVDCSENAALGIALCAAVGVGEFASYEDAIETAVRIKARHEPRPEMTEKYNRRYAKWLSQVGGMVTYWEEGKPKEFVLAL